MTDGRQRSLTPVLIMAAPNGARRSKADHPNLPITTREIAAEAMACHRAGAAIVHAHVRDGDGRHVLDATLYRELAGLIKQQAGDELLLQVSTEAARRYQLGEQIALVRTLKPAAISVALREILPEEGDAATTRAGLDFIAWLKREAIWPQFILYSPGDVKRFAHFQAQGDIPFPTPFLLFVLGRYSEGQVSNPEDLAPFTDTLGDAPAEWMMCAFGPREHDCAVAAIAAGGHVRVGFENNLHLPNGALAGSSAELVALARQAAEASGRGVMTASQLDSFRQRTS